MANCEQIFSQSPALDSEGFMINPSAWDESAAQYIARLDGIPQLTKDHWSIIQALRDHYFSFGAVPPAFSHICSLNHMEKHCVEQLFSSQREAWRIAGLPDPGEEAKAYM